MSRTPTAISTTAALLSVVLGASSSYAATLLTVLGQCGPTTIAKIGNRLQDGVTGRSVAGSGSAVSYANGGKVVAQSEVTGGPQLRPAPPRYLVLLVRPARGPNDGPLGPLSLDVNLRASS